MTILGFTFITTACGVTPQGQKTGTSFSFMFTESPKSGLSILFIPIIDGSPI